MGLYNRKNRGVYSRGVVYSALAYWIRQLFIDASKILFQFPMFKEDETEMPTTKLLLWTSDKRKSEVEIRQIARKIFEDFGIKTIDQGRRNC